MDFGSDVWIKALKAQVAVVPMEGLCPPGQKAHSYSVDPIDYFSFRGKKKKTKPKTKQHKILNFINLFSNTNIMSHNIDFFT